MSDDTESSVEAQRETLDEPEMGAASTTVAPDRDAGQLVIVLVWVMRYGAHLAITDSLSLVDFVLVFDVRVPRPFQIIGLTVGLSAVVAGHWIDGQVIDLIGGPQMMWLIDVDLLDHDGAGIYTCPTPRWSEWTVVDGQLRWAVPNLAFGRGVDLNAWEVIRTWVGSLPDPALVWALEYLRHNRKQSESKARKGESLEINSFAAVRVAAVKTVKHVMRMFERGALPDDGDVLYAEIDDVLEDPDLDSSDFIFDESPTERAPGNSDPTPNPLADPNQRRKQYAANNESE